MDFYTCTSIADIGIELINAILQKVAVCDIFHCRTGLIVPAGLIEGGLGVKLGSASCHPLLLAFETPTGSHSIGEETINHLSG